MQKHSLLFGLVGIVIGVAVGYFVTQSINNNTATNAPAAAASQAPAGGMPQEVLAMLKQANDEPDNFEAQVQAAMLYRQIGRREKEVEFLQRAAKLKPADATVLQSLTETLIQMGNKAEAQTTLQQLEKASPKNPALAELKKQLSGK
jgi:tetratricopeptide (TPR) repeat protein